MPNWVFYIEGKPYYFQNIQHIGRLLNTVRRLAEPFEQITSLATFDRFYSFSKYDVSGRLLTRNKVVGLFMDAEDYEEYIKELKLTAL